MTTRSKKQQLARQVGGFMAAGLLCLTAPVSALAATTNGSVVPETRAAFVVAVMEALKIAPDASGQSPYTDVSTSSALWRYVHTAIQDGLVQPLDKNYFGATAVVDESFAMQLAASDLHVKVADASGLASLAKSTGLFTNYLPHAIVSADDVARFITTLRLAASERSKHPDTPTGTIGEASGNTLTTAAKALLLSALLAANTPPYEQVFKQNQLTNNITLTAIGKTNAALVQGLKSHESMVTSSTMQAQDADGKQLLLLSTDVPASVSPTYAAQHTEAFLNGQSMYKNTGDGWQPVTIANSPLGQLTDVGNELDTLSSYSQLSATTSKSVTTFQGTLIPARVPAISSDFITSLFSQPLTSGQRSALLSTTKLHISYEITDVSGHPRLVGESSTDSMQVPATQLAALLLGSNPPASVKANLLRNLVDDDITLNSQSTFTYVVQPVSIPVGLPK